MITIHSGNNLPESTHVIMGDYSFKQFIFEVNDFSKDELKKYNAFINAIGSYAVVNIINIDYKIDMNRVAPFDISEEIIEIDYLTLSEIEKNIVQDFIKMIENKI